MLCFPLLNLTLNVFNARLSGVNLLFLCKKDVTKAHDGTMYNLFSFH